MLYTIRERFEKFSVKIGLLFSKIPLTANQWTLISLLPTIAALFFLVKNNFLFAGLFFLFSAFLDLVDGSVARVTGTVSKFGAYLDTIVDRYVEAIIVFGLLFSDLPSLYFPMHVWLFLYLFGAMITTYSKSAAKEKNLVEKELMGGLLERAERLIILFIAILLAEINTLYLSYAIVLLAVLANISALQRILIARKTWLFNKNKNK